MRLTAYASRYICNVLIVLTFWVIMLLPQGHVRAQTPDQVGEWGPVLNWGVHAKHMVLLPTGNVLVWPTGTNARVWNASTEASFTPVPFLNDNLHCAGHATLADGRVIIVGGETSSHRGIRSTVLFDPFTNTWTEGADMYYERWYPTATTLADGRVLATSGDITETDRATISEVYDPVTNRWTLLTGTDRRQGVYPIMFALPDGRVYEAGHETSTWFLDVNGSGAWSPGPSNSFGTEKYDSPAVMYAPGKIMRAGGNNPALAKTAVIDTTAPTPAWRETSPMAFVRRNHNMVILADGTIIAVGGSEGRDDEALAVLETEIWDPTTEQWSTVATMDEARMYHSAALLLPDGRVVAAAGEATGKLHAQIYSPPYLFKGPRPTITASPNIVSYGSSFWVGTPNAVNITSVALIRTGAVTHAFDHNQRYVPLAFTKVGDGLVATAPVTPNNAPPGYYMLIIKNTQGVPSVAAWIRLDAQTNLAPGTLTGRVTNGQTGTGISGARVASSGGSTTTNSAGNYTLTGVPSGEHLVTASAPGFATTSQPQLVPPGAVATLHFSLVGSGRVSGRVTASDTGNAIAGAAITYTGGSTTTDAGGNYSVPNIAAGPQTLTGSALGYSSTNQTVTVPVGGSVTVNFVLQPGRSTIQGEVQDRVTSTPIVGATVAYSGGSTTTDANGAYIFADVAPGLYAVTASALDYVSASQSVNVVAGSMGVTNFELAPGSPTTLTFTPVGDACVKSTSPTDNYGALTDIRLKDSSPTYRSYLKFNVSGLAGPVQNAKVRLYVTASKLEDGGTIYLVSNNYLGTNRPWEESGLTWNTAPGLSGSPLSAVGPVRKGIWVEFEVTQAITGNGSYSFGLSSTAPNSLYYSSREGANPPELVLAMSTSTPLPPPPPVADFAGDPLAGEAPLLAGFTDLSSGSPTSWEWDFGDGMTSVEQHPTHIYSDPGIYPVTLTVTSAGGTDTVTQHDYIVVNAVDTPPAADVTVETQIVASTDDAEEKRSGSMELTSSDLDLGERTVGLRFPLDVPPGATIVTAYVQFTVEEPTTLVGALTIAGQASDDALTFTSTSRNITGRPRTGATVAWTPGAWTTVDAAGPVQQTPDLAAIVQEVVDRPGWIRGKGLVFIFTGSGGRSARSYDGKQTTAPLLHVEYAQ
jgi:PKD repeat protein